MKGPAPINSYDTIKRRCGIAKPGTPFQHCYSLYKMIRKTYEEEPIGVIEIGTFTGRGTIAMAMACAPGSTVITLDPWSGMSNHGIRADLNVRGMYMSNMAVAQGNQWIDPKVQVIQIPHSSFHREVASDVEIRMQKYKNVFTFIDGHHVYDSAKNDFEHFVLPFARIGSICAFHDCTVNFPGIVKFVNNLIMHKQPVQWELMRESHDGLAFLRKIL
jgi:cephalosporin hydroxylase